MGPPGSGKTAQAILLADYFKLIHLSWGEVYRSEDFKKKYRSQERIINSRNVSDRKRSEKIAEVIALEIAGLKRLGKKGFILEGFPKRKQEAKFLLEICRKYNFRIKSLIRINPSLETCWKRMSNRYVCKQCGAVYESDFLLKKKVCPRDGKPLVREHCSFRQAKKEFFEYLEESQRAFNFLKKHADCSFDVSGDDSEITVFSNIVLKLRDGVKSEFITYYRKSSSVLETRWGSFQILSYQSVLDYSCHLALVKGDVKNKRGVLTRVHSSCITGDIFGSKKCDCGLQLREAMKKIDRCGRGVLIYLFQEGRGINIINKIKAYDLQTQGKDTVEANEELGLPAELRRYEAVRDILGDLKIKSIRLLTNNPDKVRKITDAGVVIEEILPLEISPRKENKKYLMTKKAKMGHRLKLV